MATWEDGPEYAPLERPADFSQPRVAALDTAPERPEPVALAPKERPSFSEPPVPVAEPPVPVALPPVPVVFVPPVPVTWLPPVPVVFDPPVPVVTVPPDPVEPPVSPPPLEPPQLGATRANANTAKPPATKTTFLDLIKRVMTYPPGMS